MAGILGDVPAFYYNATALSSTSYTSNLSAASELDIISNLTLNLQSDNPQFRTRGEDWVINGVGKKDGSISFEMLWVPGNAGFEAIKDAWVGRDEIAAYALDGPKATSGSQGPAGNWVVTNFTRNEPVDNFVTVNVEMKPSSYAGWHEIGS